MFKSSENLRLAAEMRALERVARPWRAARRTWFDGTPESIEGRLASTERVLTFARAGTTTAHMALEREAARARAELREAGHRLMVDFLDDGARAFKGSKRVAGDQFPTTSYPPGGHVSPDNTSGLSDSDLEAFYANDPAYSEGVRLMRAPSLPDHLDERLPGQSRHESRRRVAGKHDADPDEPWKNKATGEDTTTEHWEKNLPPWDEDYEGKHRESSHRVAGDDDDDPYYEGEGGSPEDVARWRDLGGFGDDDYDDDNPEDVAKWRDLGRGFKGSKRVAGDDDDYDEDVCGDPFDESCRASLDDGEGFDGYCGNCADRLEAQGHWGHHDASRRTAGGQITDHEFKPYSDGPEYCVEELPSSGDTCNEHFTEHARVDPEDLRFLDGGNHL